MSADRHVVSSGSEIIAVERSDKHIGEIFLYHVGKAQNRLGRGVLDRILRIHRVARFLWIAEGSVVARTEGLGAEIRRLKRNFVIIPSGAQSLDGSVFFTEISSEVLLHRTRDVASPLMPLAEDSAGRLDSEKRVPLMSSFQRGKEQLKLFAGLGEPLFGGEADPHMTA